MENNKAATGEHLIDVFSNILEPIHNFLDLHDEAGGDSEKVINVCRALSAAAQSQLDMIAKALNENLGGTVLLDVNRRNSLFHFDAVTGVRVRKPAEA